MIKNRNQSQKRKKNLQRMQNQKNQNKTKVIQNQRNQYKKAKKQVKDQKQIRHRKDKNLRNYKILVYRNLQMTMPLNLIFQYSNHLASIPLLQKSINRKFIFDIVYALTIMKQI